MKNIKEWLESTGTKTADTAFKKAVSTPFQVFLDKQGVSGHDFGNEIVEHELAVEYYSDTVDEAGEKKLEELFDKEGMEYTKEREYISEERMYMTVYQTNFTERT